MENRRTHAKGSITIELLIAFFILISAVSAAVIVLWQSQTLAVDTQTSNEGLYLAQGLLEDTRASSRNTFAAVQSWAAPTTVTSGALSYTKNLSVADINTYTKQATSTVTWTIGGRSFSIVLSTLLTDLTSALGVDSCSQTLTGDWKHPQHWDSSVTSLLPGNQSNGFGISDMQENRGVLYITANSLMNNGFTLVVFDLSSDPSATPTYAGGFASNSQAVNAIALSKSGTKVYAYLASGRVNNFATCAESANCAQLQVVDVSSPTVSGWSPNNKNFKVPGIIGTGGQGTAQSIFYDGGYVYLGLQTGGGPEFQIIDVHNPLSPVIAGNYPVGRTVEGIFVKGNYAYLTTDDNTGTNKQVLVLDISNKNATPLPLATYFKVSGAGFGRTVSVNNNQIYAGRTYTSGSPTLYILDGSNLGVQPVPMLGKVNGADNVLAVSGRGTYMFDLTNSQFQVWDISNPGSPVPWTSDGTTNTFMSLSAVGGSGTTFNCAGNYFYTAVQSSQGNHKDIMTIITPGAIAPSSLNLEIRDPSEAALSSATAGQTVHAALSVAGSLATPSGTATFTYYTNSSCSGAGSGAGTVALAGGVANPSTAEGPLTVGGGFISFKAHYSGNYQYSALDSSCVSILVTKADQTITVNTHAPASAAYNSTFPVAATSDSGLAVALTVSGGVCSISGGTVTMTGSSGNCVVHYNQAGNANYNPATEITETVAATKAPSVTTVTCPASVTYSGAAQTPCTTSVTGTGGLSLNPAPTYANNTNAGTATASYTFAGDTNHTGSADSKNFTINKATPTITWANPSAITYGTPLSATQLNASTGIAGTFTYTPPAGTVLNAGAQILSVHFAPTDTTDYNTPADKTVSITVNKANPNITTTIFNSVTGLPITHAAVGVSVLDKATLTAPFGTPTGTVTFTVSKNKTNCGSPTQSGGTGTITAGVAQSIAYVVAGNTSYSATYNGDSNFNSVTAACEALPSP